MIIIGNILDNRGTYCMNKEFEIVFYGVRGSYPVTNKKMLKYGGNTSCVYMKVKGENLIFDAGTGIIDLGDQIVNNDIDASIFITHMHYDHVQGIGFFKPLLFNENSSFKIYCQDEESINFEDDLRSFIKAPMFPYTIENYKAKHQFIPINGDETIEVTDDIKVHTINNNHPSGGTSYKVVYNNKSCCYVTDHELNDENRDEFKKFIQSCDVLIMDSTYNNEEYKTKNGWGHSMWEDAVAIAKEANVGKLFLFHHDPSRTDKDLDKQEKEAQKIFKNTFCAREGVKVRL